MDLREYHEALRQESEIMKDKSFLSSFVSCVIQSPHRLLAREHLAGAFRLLKKWSEFRCSDIPVFWALAACELQDTAPAAADHELFVALKRGVAALAPEMQPPGTLPAMRLFLEAIMDATAENTVPLAAAFPELLTLRGCRYVNVYKCKISVLGLVCGSEPELALRLLEGGAAPPRRGLRGSDLLAAALSATREPRLREAAVRLFSRLLDLGADPNMPVPHEDLHAWKVPVSWYMGVLALLLDPSWWGAGADTSFEILARLLLVPHLTLRLESEALPPIDAAELARRRELPPRVVELLERPGAPPA